MALVKRPTIGYPVTEIDIKNINDFNRQLMYKVFGNIDFADLAEDAKGAINSKLSLINTQSFSYVPNGSMIVTLPDEFKGKDFKPMLAVSKAYPTGDLFIRYWNIYIDEETIDKANATFTIWVNVICSDLYNNPATNKIYAVDNSEGGGADFTVITIV